MYDHYLFLRTLSRFSAKLLSPYDVDNALQDLMEKLRDMLALEGCGVALARHGRLELTTTVPDHLAELEQVQLQHQAGPCLDAYRSGAVVAVADLEKERDRWPEYCAVAERLRLVSVAGIPMRLGDNAVGALNLYDTAPRLWSPEDLAAAVVMADVATNYLISSSKLKQEQQLNDQLQHALDSKAVIEQAKGVVAYARDTTIDQAFDLIRGHARSNNVSVRSVAESIVHLSLRV